MKLLSKYLSGDDAVLAPQDGALALLAACAANELFKSEQQQSEKRKRHRDGELLLPGGKMSREMVTGMATLRCF